MSDRPPLTAQQARVLACVVGHLRDTGAPPTFRAIMTEFGFASTNSVNRHVNALVRKGYLVRLDDATGRNLVVPEIHAAVQAAARAYLEGLSDG